jgi:hypothetical protein
VIALGPAYDDDGLFRLEREPYRQELRRRLGWVPEGKRSFGELLIAAIMCPICNPRR